MKTNTTELAAILNKLLPQDTMATVLNCLLSCDQDSCLTDDEARIGMSLFDNLMDIVTDETVNEAQGE